MSAFFLAQNVPKGDLATSKKVSKRDLATIGANNLYNYFLTIF